MKYPIHIVSQKGSTDSLSEFLNKLNIVLNGFGHQYGNSSEFRVSTDFEIIYCTGGVCYVNIGEQTYVGEKGDLFFIPPYTKNRIKSSDTTPSQNFWMHFDIDPLYFTDSFMTAIMGKTDVYYMHLGILPWVISLYENIEQETKQEHLGFQQMRIDLFRTILIELIRARVSITGQMFSTELAIDKRNHLVLQADTFIRENLHRKIQVVEIAQALAVSEPYLFKVFSAVMHISPTAYINLQKAKAAKLAIQTSDEPLSEIAERLGFGSYYYFSNFFKKIYGLSPKMFREETSNTIDVVFYR